MNKEFERVNPGDVIRADYINEICETVESLDRVGRGDGIASFRSPSFSAQSVDVPIDQLLVRITQDVFPEGSAEYVANPPTGTNAVPQVYSKAPNSNGGPTGWVDNPAANAAILISNYGTVPLVTNDLVLVYFDTGASKWIPTYQILTNTVRVSSTTINAAGFYDGFIQVYNTDMTPPAVSDGPQVHCQGPNGETLSLTKYPALRIGHKSGRGLFNVMIGGSNGIFAKITGAGNSVSGVTVTAGGSGYSSAPTVSFSGGGGSGAMATATVSGGAVVSVAVTAGGTGYTSAPSVSFGGPGTGASATATVGAYPWTQQSPTESGGWTATGGVVTGVTVTAGGSGYTSAPSVTFTGGGGTGAAATATVSVGAVISVTATAGGSGYTSAPMVGFGGPGTGAAATATISTAGTATNNPAYEFNDNTGVPLNSIVLLIPGAPQTTVSFTGGGGTGAAGSVTVVSGTITAVTITNGGSGYTSAPTVSFTGAGGSGATATATVSGGAVTSVTVTAGGSGYPQQDQRFHYNSGGLPWSSAGAATTVAANTVVYMPVGSPGGGAYYDATNLFKIPSSASAGLRYLFTASLTFATSNTSADFGCKSFVNGNTTLPATFNSPGSCTGGSIKLITREVLTLNPGDTIRLGAFHNWVGFSPSASAISATLELLG